LIATIHYEATYAITTIQETEVMGKITWKSEWNPLNAQHLTSSLDK